MKMKILQNMRVFTVSLLDEDLRVFEFSVTLS